MYCGYGGSSVLYVIVGALRGDWKGAQMGDLFMSLIHTCELNDVNAFHYLTVLLRHPEELKQNPSEWMPWNSCNTLAPLATPAAAEYHESNQAEKEYEHVTITELRQAETSTSFTVAFKEEGSKRQRGSTKDSWPRCAGRGFGTDGGA